MKPWLWIAGVVFAACGTTGSNEKRVEVPRTADEHEPRLVKNADKPPSEDGWLESWFTVEGFPAVSTDGRYVVMARELGDGARGYPNLRVEAWQVTDGRRVLEAVIVDANDSDAEGDDFYSGFPERFVAKANAGYAAARKFMQAHAWVTMTPLATTSPWDMDRLWVPHATDDGSIVIQLDEPTVRVDFASDAQVLERGFPEWSTTPDYTPCGEDPADHYEGCACQDPNYASNVFVDRARDVLLFEVNYIGNDTCWEPEIEYHAMRLPTDGAKGWKRVARDVATMRLADQWSDTDASTMKPEEASDAERNEALKFLAFWGARYPSAAEVLTAKKFAP